MKPTYFTVERHLEDPNKKCNRISYIMPILYICLGLFIGLQMRGQDSKQLKWLKSPTWMKRTSPQTQLFDAKQAEKVLHLRQRIDEEIDAKMNDVETTVVSYDPVRFSFELLDRLDEEFDAFFHDMMSTKSAKAPEGWMNPPTFDVVEDSSQMTITCTAPGVALDDVNLDLKGRQLTISFSKEANDEGSQMWAHFVRVFIVPQGVQAKDVAASIAGDELRIVIPKPRLPTPVAEPIIVQPSEP